MKQFVIVMLILLAVIVAGCSTESNAETPATGSGNSVADSASNDVVADSEPNNTPAGSEDAPVDVESNSEVKVLKVTSYDFGFNIEGPEINEGDKVRIEFTSTSGTHGLSIPGLNVNTGAAGPGDTKTVEFTADQSGSFEYFCNIPCGSGHRSMKGNITVN